eukprot:scaffold8132_cov109-Skeletonema_marinoi.AAC.2
MVSRNLLTTSFDEDKVKVLALVAPGALSAFEESGGLAHALFKGVDFCHNDCAIFRCGYGTSQLRMCSSVASS